MPLFVLEGIDGSGKTTQSKILIDRLLAQGREVSNLREPGGTELGEKIRAILLDRDTEACPEAELFMYLAARAQLCRKVFAPLLNRGVCIVLDRFWYSTVAYQGYGLGLPINDVTSAIRLSVGSIRVHQAILLDIPIAAAKSRRDGVIQDRIERRGDAYFQAVMEGYQAQAQQGLLQVIDGAQSVDIVSEEIWKIISRSLTETEQ